MVDRNDDSGRDDRIYDDRNRDYKNRDNRRRDNRRNDGDNRERKFESKVSSNKGYKSTIARPEGKRRFSFNAEGNDSNRPQISRRRNKKPKFKGNQPGTPGKKRSSFNKKRR